MDGYIVMTQGRGDLNSEGRIVMTQGKLLELPRFWSPEPILAWKIMQTKIGEENAMQSARVTNKVFRLGEIVEAECRALDGVQCSSKHGDPIPLANHYCDCKKCTERDGSAIFNKITCGFYGWKIDHIPPYHEIMFGTPVIVEFSGLVLEHEWGYKASHQRIIIIGSTGREVMRSSGQEPTIRAFLESDEVRARREKTPYE